MTKKNKERAISVLWIDDEHDTKLESFRFNARKNRVIIKKACKSSEEGMQELEKNFNSYDAVILDAFALRKATDAIGATNAKSLRDSINRIKEIERKENRKIIFCVYTGQKEKMGDIWEDEIHVFKKLTEREQLFTYLKTEVEKLPETKIIHQYYDVFELFESSIIDINNKGRLLHILKKTDSSQREIIEDKLSHIRKVLESLYKTLHQIGRIDSRLIINGRPKYGWCQLYVSGRTINVLEDLESPIPIVPEHISWSLKLIEVNTSAIGAHNYKDLETVTNYTLKTATFALLDVLLWFKTFTKENA